MAKDRINHPAASRPKRVRIKCTLALRAASSVRPESYQYGFTQYTLLVGREGGLAANGYIVLIRNVDKLMGRSVGRSKPQ
jgi:hypothetical protein